ncbi:MAG: glycosyltransferase family 4 protein [Patescibacteria group bacterium]|jgi:glycosyltransferase involved in cell wall biosynthesis
MKLLLVTHIFPPAIDGGSKILWNLSQYLSKNNDILVITSNCHSTDDFVNPRSTIPKYKDNNTQNYQIIRLPVYKNITRPLKLLNLLFHSSSLNILTKGPVFKFIPFLATLIIIKKYQPDLIITGPFPTACNLYSQVFKKLFSAKMLSAPCFHANDNFFHAKPLINTLHSADYIWALSRFEKNYLNNNFNVHPNKILALGAGIENDLLIKPTNINFPETPHLLFIGSLAAHKNIIDLISAFRLLYKKFPQAKLTIAGKKTLYYPIIEKYIKKLPQNIQRQIIFAFNFKNDNLKKLIDKSSVLVLPSREESFGLVLIESWARGKPVITSDIPTLKELVKKTRGGITFELGSADCLAKAIDSLFTNPKLSRSLGLNGFIYVKNNLTWDRITKSLWSKVSR